MSRSEDSVILRRGRPWINPMAVDGFAEEKVRRIIASLMIDLLANAGAGEATAYLVVCRDCAGDECEHHDEVSRIVRLVEHATPDFAPGVEITGTAIETDYDDGHTYEVLKVTARLTKPVRVYVDEFIEARMVCYRFVARATECCVEGVSWPTYLEIARRLEEAGFGAGARVAAGQVAYGLARMALSEFGDDYDEHVIRVEDGFLWRFIGVFECRDESYASEARGMASRVADAMRVALGSIPGIEVDVIVREDDELVTNVVCMVRKLCRTSVVIEADGQGSGDGQ